MKLELGNMIMQVVVFLILAYFLRRVAWKPFAKLLHDRQTLIETQITTAESNRKEAEELVEEHRKLMAQARQEAHDLIEHARKSGDHQAAEILALAETESKRIRTEAQADIEQQKQQALSAVSRHVAELTVLLSSRVLARELDAPLRSALVDEATKELSDIVC
jgi:F-type H+-transporting ATPase subunit b